MQHFSQIVPRVWDFALQYFSLKLYCNYNYFRPPVRRAVNVLKLMFLRVSKYPPNAIFRNANINAQRANVTINVNDLAYKSAAAYIEHAIARPMLVLLKLYNNSMCTRVECRNGSEYQWSRQRENFRNLSYNYVIAEVLVGALF